jgi:hypothetical protein
LGPKTLENNTLEHPRIVPDWLWYKANEVVDTRQVFKKPVPSAGNAATGDGGCAAS